MKPYIIKRILSAIPLLVIISFVCFVFINLIPSDPAEVALRVRQVPIITEEAIAEVRAELGLDQPYLVMGLSSRGFWNQLCESNQNSSRRTAAVSPSNLAAGRSFLCDGHYVKPSNWLFVCSIQGRLV